MFKRLLKENYFLVFSIFLFLNFIFFENNESSILITARHVYNPSWIATDWWLNTGIEYGAVFNYFAGFIYELTNFTATFILGRIYVYLLWAYIFTKWFKRLSIPIWMIPLSVCIFQKNEGIYFGEWMFSGFETKTFAYLSFFFALEFLFKKRFIKSAFFLGLSVSFHVLVGVYLTLAFAAIVFIKEWKNLTLKEIIFKISPAYFFGSIFGIVAVVKWLLTKNLTDAITVKTGSIIYVTKRVFHHVMFQSNLSLYVFIFLFVIGLIYISRNKSLDKSLNYLYLIATFSLLYLITGIYFSINGPQEMLKFYFFRTPDVLVPFTVVLTFIAFFSSYIQKFNHKKYYQFFVTFILLIGISRTLYRFEKGRQLFLTNFQDKNDSAYQWVKEHTAKDDSFIVNVKNERFYLFAERPILVAFKHSPQKEKHIVEWYNRITELNNGTPPASSSWQIMHEIENNFKNLKKEKLIEIGKKYNLKYVFVENKFRFDLPVAYQSEKYTIFKLF